MAQMKDENLVIRYTGKGKERVKAAAEKVGMTMSSFSAAIISAVVDAVLATEDDNFYRIEERLALIGRMLNAKYQARLVDEKFREMLDETDKEP